MRTGPDGNVTFGLPLLASPQCNGPVVTALLTCIRSFTFRVSAVYSSP